jgi:hypothetical protein
VVSDSFDTEIVGWNPSHGMDICRRVSVLCCPVGRGLSTDDHSSKQVYQICIKICSFICILYLEQGTGHNVQWWIMMKNMVTIFWFI